MRKMILAVAISSLAMVSMGMVTGCYNKPKEEPKPAESAAPAAPSAPAAPAAPAAPPAGGGAAK
jgi:hypothetical protein